MFFECLDVFAICWVKTYWDELDNDLVGAVLSSDTIFTRIFRPFLTQLHSAFLISPFSLMLAFVIILPSMPSRS